MKRESSRQTADRQRGRQIAERNSARWPMLACAIAAIALIPLLAVVLTYVSRPGSPRVDRKLLGRLTYGDPQVRKQAAWIVAERQAGIEASLAIRPRLENRAESDPQVREAYVYALGRIGAHGFADTIEVVVREDESGYVRAAAWLALARCDPSRLRRVALLGLPRETPWDRIGLAQAWAELGDLRGLNELLHWAVEGDHSQRVVAAAALGRDVAPVLDAVGRWPIGADVTPDAPWPAELVAELDRRARTVDLNEIAADVRARLEASQRIRRDVYRLTSVRERVARLLFSHWQ